ncbi:MAG: DEAD/DEAH box helicase, partial [Clostridia bacterium]|nr:DEAD/DEAH box helicase [Clostridia bacterium]
MRKVTIAAVALDGAVGSYDRLYSYIIPDELSGGALAGCRVFVPFGKGNTKRIGMVFSACAEETDKPLKSVISVMDESPVLSAEMLNVCLWMHDNVFCTYFDAVNVMLPAGLRYKLAGFYSANPEFADKSLLNDGEALLFAYINEAGEVSEEKLKSVFGDCRELLLALSDKDAIIHTVAPKRNMGDLTRKWVRITDSDCSLLKLTPRQREVLDAVQVTGEVSIKELQYFTGATVSVINALIGKGILEGFERQEFRMPPRYGNKPKDTDITLNREQTAAFEGLKDKMLSGKGETALLYGVTGSGKTQVFLKLADECIKNERGVIIMVPEIALTPQMINLFSSRYQSKVAVFHSAMSLGQRMDEYRRIAMGKALIAVGTRSAVFAPLDRLGLVILDEEHESTYQSENSPRYHAREVAKFRCVEAGCMLLLGSATPSVESMYEARRGVYSLFQLRSRFNTRPLPKVYI